MLGFVTNWFVMSSFFLYAVEFNRGYEIISKLNYVLLFDLVISYCFQFVITFYYGICLSNLFLHLYLEFTDVFTEFVY